MKTKISTIPNENVFFLLVGALFSALIIVGDVGFVSGDVLLFSLVAYLVSLTLVFFIKTSALKSCLIRSTYQHKISRKDITHHNDPLLM